MSSTIRTMLLLGGLLAGSTAGGCTTDVQFANMVPGATVENMRWQPDSSSQLYASPTSLEPGDTSANVPILDGDEDESGLVSFELLVKSNRVALVVREPFTATEHETSIFTLKPETAVYNPVLEEKQGALAQLPLADGPSRIP